jgi:glycosyltransferase involved in cell wall biosynthesis
MPASARLADAAKAIVIRFAWLWFELVHRSRRNSRDWVVGVEEIASMVRQLADVLPRSTTVVFGDHPFYDFHYDHAPVAHPGRLGRAWDIVVRRPLLFARLASEARGFVYVGARGFLASAGGTRAPEFRFLRRRGVRICCYFTGSDIRSLVRLEALERETGVPNLSSRFRLVNPETFLPVYDEQRRRTAADADAFADVVYSASVDQLSYLARPTEPFLYLLPEHAFAEPSPPPRSERLVVLHAPSSPIVKGTEFVRDAVRRLRDEGHDFDYVELSKVPHTEVTAALRRADIVLNQFFAYMPGVFGVEALAAGCAVMMSADGRVEPDLAPGANEAWLVTRHDEIVENLRSLLTDRDRIDELAERGWRWARRYASAEASGERLRTTLDRVLAGTYSGPRGWAE